MEKLLEERICENLTNEEKNAIMNNKNLAEKIYLIGLIDGIKITGK